MWNEKSHRLEQAQVTGLPQGWHVFGLYCSIAQEILMAASSSKTIIGLCVGRPRDNAFHFLLESVSTNLPGHMPYALISRTTALFGSKDGIVKSDDTPEGTFLLCDIAPGLASGDPHYFCSVGEWIYFVADDGVYGKEIWRTNGTGEGTHLVVDLMPGQAGSGPWGLTAYQEKLFFCANSPDFGEEVFFMDGTSEGTRILKDIAPGPAWSGPDNLCVFGDYLFFSSNDGIYGEELWISDGTANGTRLAADIRHSTQALNPSSSPSELTAAGDLLLFVVQTPEYDKTLWQSDTTEQGTHPVAQAAQFNKGTGPRCLTASADLVFFSAQDDERGREPWVYDPKGRECRILKDLCPGPCDSNPDHFLSVEQWMYFSADDGIHGRRVWRSSASGNNTEMLNLAPDRNGGLAVVQIFALLGHVYCYVNEGPASASLWRVDAKRGLVEHLLHFKTPLPPWDPDEPHVLPVLGGEDPLTEDLVEELYLAGAICPYNPEPRAPDTAVLEDKLIFPAYTNAHGAELWRTDGTRAGVPPALELDFSDGQNV